MSQIVGPLVDSHFHIYTREMPMADTAWHTPTEDASVERAIETMDANGVMFGVIGAASIYGTYNDYVRTAIKGNKRLRATVMPDFDWDIKTMESYLEDGFTGARFLWRPMKELPDITSEKYKRFLRRCADIGWHIHITDKPHRIESTIKALENEGVTVVLDHLCLIDTDEGVNDPGFKACLEAIDRGNTWVKMSAAFRFTHPGLADAAAKDLVAAGGWDRMMWASDWPFAGFEDKLTYADTVDDLSRWVPDADMRACVGGRTALKFFFL